MFENEIQEQKEVTVLGITFASDQERRTYFRDELRKKLPELKKMEGFPLGEDDDIINLSDPPYYTACPNPWLNDFIQEWEESKTKPTKNVQFPYSKGTKANKNHPIYNAHSYHTKVPHLITTKYIYYYTNPGDIIIDTFAGTGMSGVGGSYCNSIEPSELDNLTNDLREVNSSPEIGKRNVINVDLSPIASFISSVYNSNVDLNLLVKEYEYLRTLLQNEIDFYKTTVNGNKLAKINHCIYSQVLECTNCEEEFTFYKGAYNDDNKLKGKVHCPNCGLINERKNFNYLTETVFDEISNKSILQLKYKPVLINYSIEKGKAIKEVDESDLTEISRIKILYPEKIPNSEMRDGVESKRNVKNGLTHVHHFYTKRTLSSISTFMNSIEPLQHKRYFLFLLTAVLPKLTKLNRYMPQHGSRALVGPMANTLYLPPLFVENNFLKQIDFQFKKIIKALKFSASQISSCQSATDLSNLKSNSIDYIFIDPPFGANITYSELNNLPEGFLKILTNNHEEAIESRGQGKGKFEYEALMIKSFQELFRLLKPGRWMTVEFSNTSAAIWNIIQFGLTKSGFVISKIDTLNKERGGLHAMIGPVAVKQDLVISCYKASENIKEKFESEQSAMVSIWDFLEDHLNHLPVHSLKDESTAPIIERSPKILFDRLIAFYVQRSLPVPINASNFQVGLKERFIERDGMYFTNEQVEEYDRKKSQFPKFIQLSLLISSEQDGVLWLRNVLQKKSLAYQEIHPMWMQALAGVRKGDLLPELTTILEENFLKYDSGKWYLPDPENEADLEKLRIKRLIKQFDIYKEIATKPKGKIKECRVDALRVGFKQCYQDKDFKTIVMVGDRIPNNLLMEDEVLLQFYDIASSRV